MKQISVERVLALVAAADQLYRHGGSLVKWFKQQEPLLDLRPAEPVDESADRARQRGIDEQAEALLEKK